jgi:glycine betaine/proline transport system substrate-binding protein
MGYPVEIVEGSQDDQWDALTAGDAIHANLEVWPVLHADKVATYVTSGKVEDGGRLGPIGKVGWFIPSYLLAAHPLLESWHGFQDKSVAALFQTPESGDRGRFLAGDRSWGQYDEQIIANLELDFTVVWSGSEQATLDQLERAYARRAPILFYFWVPHAAHAKYALTNVLLPPHSEACYAKASVQGIDCDYPSEHLLKVFTWRLKQIAPAAYEFLKSFSYTTKDQIDLLAKIYDEHVSVEDAARWWIANNTAIWKSWIPAEP